jgi:hypothetical protein
MRHVFTEDAAIELEEAIEYYQLLSTQVARKFVDAIDNKLVQIEEHPGSAAKVRGEIRKSVLTSYPYSLIYSISDEIIYIIAFMNNYRKPDYWVSRI